MKLDTKIQQNKSEKSHFPMLFFISTPLFRCPHYTMHFLDFSRVYIPHSTILGSHCFHERKDRFSSTKLPLLFLFTVTFVSMLYSVLHQHPFFVWMEGNGDGGEGLTFGQKSWAFHCRYSSNKDAYLISWTLTKRWLCLMLSQADWSTHLITWPSPHDLYMYNFLQIRYDRPWFNSLNWIVTIVLFHPSSSVTIDWKSMHFQWFKWGGMPYQVKEKTPVPILSCPLLIWTAGIISDQNWRSNRWNH